MRQSQVMGRRGFALLEVLIASAMLVTVAVGIAQISAIAIRSGAASRARTMATAMAAQKMEQLRSLTWSESTDTVTGARLLQSDRTTDLSVTPDDDAGPGLAPSPDGTLDDNVMPYVDYLDADGNWAGNGTGPPLGAVYSRRWSIRPLEEDPVDTLVLQVRVTWSREGRSVPWSGSPSSLDDVRLVSVRSRIAR
jgi:type II secretory pathway pseudopilin PulG